MPLGWMVRRSSYFDSIALMRAAEQARQVAGVTDVAAVMGTPANRALLAGAGLSSADTPETDVSDLLVAVRAATDEAVQDALRRFAELLSARREVGAGHDERPPRTTWTAARVAGNASQERPSADGKCRNE